MNISENCTKILKALKASHDPGRYLALFAERSFKDLKQGELVVELLDIQLFFRDERHVLACHSYAMEKM